MTPMIKRFMNALIKSRQETANQEIIQWLKLEYPGESIEYLTYRLNNGHFEK